MDRLWSPWRYEYVSKTPVPNHEKGCIFCEKPAAGKDEEQLILFRGAHNYVLLNLYPYTTGHLMIAPYEHIAEFDKLAPEVAAELMELTQRAVRHLKAVYHPQGINLGMNLGECAGAGVACHLHMHVLPRWTGDASFMTTIGQTRVMPEDLPETWRKLRAAFHAG